MDEYTIKDIQKKIEAELKVGTVYRIKPGLRFVPDDNSFENKEESVQLMVANGMITVRDLFYLSGVHGLGHATVTSLVRRLAMEKRRNPELGIEVPQDMRLLKRRLGFLVQQGLLYRFSYDVESSPTRVSIYVCSPLGYRVFRTHLMMSIPFDRISLYRSTSDVMRKLSSNAVAYSFASSNLCKGVILNESISYGDAPKDKKMSLYARTSLENSSVKKRYIIEPVYFEVEPELTTEAQNLKNIDERLVQLQNMLEYYIEKENWDAYLVFVVEDMQGLMKLLQMLKFKQMQFFMDHALFTSENVISRNHFHLQNSFLRIVYKSDGKYTVVLDQKSILY